MERNYTPMKIATRRMETIVLHNTEYSPDVRGRVTALILPLAHQFDAYTSEWLFDVSWKTEGDRLHKRIANKIFRNCGVRVPGDTLTKIAEIAANERERSLHFDVTRRFQWEPGDYGDNRSCYWGSYKPARITYLPKLGAVAVRLYSKQADGIFTGAGRFWLLPVPHVGSEVADYFLAFNFYGGFQNGENVAELATHVLGDNYEKANFRGASASIEGTYVNDGQVMIFKRKGAPDGDSHVNITYADMMASALPLPKWGGNEQDRTDMDDMDEE